MPLPIHAKTLMRTDPGRPQTPLSVALIGSVASSAGADSLFRAACLAGHALYPFRSTLAKEISMALVHPKYKVAVVQAAPAWLDLDAGIDKTIELINEAAAAGAKLVAFPETWLPGYPWHIWMGSHAWQVGRGFVQRYFDNSLDYDSDEARRLSAAVAKAGVTVVLGLSERSGGSLYIAQWIIGPDGKTIATRRKLRPTQLERTVYGEGDGSDLAVHTIEGLGRVGALCCWEHLQPLSKYAMYAQNEQVHVAAWPSFSNYDPFAHALGAEVNNAASKIYAVEGSCFVLAPCAVVSQAMIDELCDTPEKHQLNHVGGGHAVIYGPDGSPLVSKLPEDQEGILYADIDLGVIAMAKNAADPAGHYSRPDVTRLLFNKTPMSRVQIFALPIDTLDTSEAASA
jgi:nitrilase